MVSVAFFYQERQQFSEISSFLWAPEGKFATVLPSVFALQCSMLCKAKIHSFLNIESQN